MLKNKKLYILSSVLSLAVSLALFIS